MIGLVFGWLGRLALCALLCGFSALALARLARRGRERPTSITAPAPLVVLLALSLLLISRFLAPFLPSVANPAHPWNLLPVAAGLGGALLLLFFCAPRPRWILPRNERPGMRYALVAYASALPALAGVYLVWRALADAQGLPTRHEILVGYSSLAPLPAFITLLLTLGLMPILEELIFRGWLFGSLSSDPRTGPLLALAISSLAFGLSHQPGMWLPATALGLLFGWVYWRVGDVRAPILLHVLHNLGVLLWGRLL